MGRLTVFFYLMLVLSCGAICSSALTTFPLEDKLQELELRLEAKIGAKNAQLEEKVTQMEAQLELNNELRQDLALKVTQLEDKNVQLEVKIGKLEAKVEQLNNSLFKNYFSREKNERTAAATDSVPISNNASAVAFPGIPSSCADLKEIGHIWDGIFTVMGSAKMESVYCDFKKETNETGFQKWIGYVDVKSSPVHFYAQRNSAFNKTSTPIPFDLALVNEGNGMDLTSGKFTAPRPGIYFFSFAGTANIFSSSYVQFISYLYLNGNIIGSSTVAEWNGPVDQWSPLTLQSTLNLKKGDQLWVTFYYWGSSSYLYSLYDDSAHLTHFTGFMLEEEIAASL